MARGMDTQFSISVIASSRRRWRHRSAVERGRFGSPLGVLRAAEGSRRVSVDAGLNACYILVWCRHEVVGIVHGTQLEVGGLRRWIALSRILLVLVFNGLEATHTH